MVHRIGKELSGPLVATLVGLLFSNLGVIGGSNAAGVYDTVNRYVLPLAIPLLLFSADLRWAPGGRRLPPCAGTCACPVAYAWQGLVIFQSTSPLRHPGKFQSQE